MSEKEKMLAGQLYNHYDKQLTIERKEIAEKELTRLNELVSTASEIIGGAV